MMHDQEHGLKLLVVKSFSFDGIAWLSTKGSRERLLLSHANHLATLLHHLVRQPRSQ